LASLSRGYFFLFEDFLREFSLFSFTHHKKAKTNSRQNRFPVSRLFFFIFTFLFLLGYRGMKAFFPCPSIPEFYHFFPEVQLLPDKRYLCHFLKGAAF